LSLGTRFGGALVCRNCQLTNRVAA